MNLNSDKPTLLQKNERLVSLSFSEIFLHSYKPVFFNLFEVAEFKVTAKNFQEPKCPSKKLRGTPTFLI